MSGLDPALAGSPLSGLDPALQGTLRLALAWLLLAAGAHKLRHPAAFREALAGYRLLPRGLGGLAARVLTALELGSGLALLAPGPARFAGVVAAGLFALYAGAITLNLARGRRQIDCGCGGPGRRRPLSGGLVARNLLLVCAAVASSCPAASRPLVWLDVVTVGAGALVLALLYAAADLTLELAPRLASLRGQP